MKEFEQKRLSQGSWSLPEKNQNWQRQTRHVHSAMFIMEGKEAEKAAFSTSQVLQDFRQRLLDFTEWKGLARV